MSFNINDKKDFASESPEVSMRPSTSSLIRRFRPLLLAGVLGLMAQGIPGCAHETGSVRKASPVPEALKESPDSKNKPKTSRRPHFEVTEPYKCEDNFRVGTDEFIECCLWHWQCELATNINDDKDATEQLAMR